MKAMWLFLLLAAVGSSVYHIGQKSLYSVPANPMLILSLYYAAAFSFSIVLMPLFGRAGLAEAAGLAANWRVWLVALGILMIELGFLLAYQSGGSAQWSGVAVNGAAALLLIPVSLLFFQEQFSWHKILGIVLTLSGMYFLVKK